MFSPRKTVFAAIVFFGAFFAGHAIAQEKSIVVASTTSTQDSGLFDYLLPLSEYDAFGRLGHFGFFKGFIAASRCMAPTAPHCCG